jgi:hypothetical protein
MSGTVALADVRVTNLQLEKSSQFTEFSIVCDQYFEFDHQIVEATADRPHRIVVDVFDAVHRLPQWDFTGLPSGSIKRIRTSQFATEPRKVVRVVLDVAGELTYKVDKAHNVVTLHINTPAEGEFPKWSAAEPGEPTVRADNQPSQSMPARPGNEANASVVDQGQPGNNGPQLAAKPSSLPQERPKQASESEVETAPNPTHDESWAPPIVMSDFDAFAEAVSKKQQNPAPGEQTDQSAGTKSPTGSEKINDSAALTPEAPLPRKPVPAESEPPQAAPKSEKSALPEVKAATRPELADQSDVTGADAQTESKTESVRKKYLAKVAGEDIGSPATAEADPAITKPVLDKVERIRQKYRKGIEFVVDDEDAARLAAQAEQEREEEVNSDPAFYDEFIPQREVVVYTSQGLRDPFAPLIEQAAEAQEQDDLPEVATLRLIGVLQDTETSRALLEDYNGYAYILETGDRVRNGFLVSIAEDHVVFQIRQYGWSRRVAIELESEI